MDVQVNVILRLQSYVADCHGHDTTMISIINEGSYISAPVLKLGFNTSTYKTSVVFQICCSLWINGHLCSD